MLQIILLLILLGFPSCRLFSIDSHQLILSSPAYQEANQGDILFISGILENLSGNPLKTQVQLTLPEGWKSVLQVEPTITVGIRDPALLIYGIKIPCHALARNYHLRLEDQEIIVRVLPKQEFMISVENQENFYPKNDPITLQLRCFNHGNFPLHIVVNATTDPPCYLQYFKESFEISPQESYLLNLYLEPDLSCDDDKQYLLLKFLDQDCDDILYQNTICLNSTCLSEIDDDDKIYIPARMRSIALGDNGKQVVAIEFCGEGIIDPVRERYLEFDFLVPSDMRNVIYNQYQRFFVSVSEPNWQVNLGDTTYALSTLTQRCRYGRGAGIDLTNERWAIGTHYTQNIFNNDYNPKEFCSYVEYTPKPMLSFSGNYLHKVLRGIPTSNILTLQTDFAFPRGGITEIEIGKNFIEEHKHRDTTAYRIEMRGQCFTDSWYNFEKIYTGPAFYGYYQHLHSITGTVDFPLSTKWRANISYNRFSQNYDAFKATDLKDCPLAPRQWQQNNCFTYNATDCLTVAFNTLLLRSKDMGFFHEYNFFQKWAGVSFFLNKGNYSLNAITSFGQQHDYLTGKTTRFLQRYYLYLGRQLTSNLSSSLFYDAGNINYYDARPWRFGYGGSLCYQYSQRGRISFFAQRFKNTPDRYNLTQFSINLIHTFRNKHHLELLMQYFHYQKHYPNDAMFLLSYTVPFNVPAGLRSDIGRINGYVYDTWNHSPVPQAIVNCCDAQAISNDQGLFAFSKVPIGDTRMDIDRLPAHLISQYQQTPTIEVVARRPANICLPVVPACTIRGSVIATSHDPFTNEISQQEGLANMEIIICHEQNHEVYNTFTDKYGHFKFAKLRPGIWHIHLPNQQLPAYHEAKAEHFVINVLPTENKFVVFEVKPVKPKFYRLE